MNTTMDFLANNSSTGGDGEDHPSVYLGAVGRKVVGKIVGTPHTAETTFGPRLVVDLEVVEGTNCLKGKNGNEGAAEVGEILTLWIKPGNQAAAVRTALENVEAKGLEPGGTLALALTDQKDVGKGNPLNIHAAQYKPAIPAVAVTDDLI